MMNDTVREELQTKITSGSLPRLTKASEPPASKPPVPTPPASTPAPARRVVTAGLVAPKTSPTLVDFKAKNAPLPEWRLQIQNAVQQRRGTTAAATAPAPAFPTSGSAALNVQRQAEAEPEAPADPLVAKAMTRIAESRKTFAEAPVKTKTKIQPQPRPFGVVPASGPSTAAAAPQRTISPAKPKLVAPPAAERRDTNKLPPIDEVQQPPDEEVKKTEAVVAETPAEPAPSGRLKPEIKRIEIKVEKLAAETTPADEPYEDEIEDLAPFSMRFGAGLFDLIISGFATMLLLSPLAFITADWFAFGSMLTIVGSYALVSFVYMTICLGFYGKTVGMRLFSIELVDAVDNEYPTLRQAAVNSAVFLLSLGLAGAGFAAVFFNEERRALHDLLSGTILVREF